MRTRNASEAGYQAAYAATSWTLTGKTFNASQIAREYAARDPWVTDETSRDQFVLGFLRYLLRHDGTWTARF